MFSKILKLLIPLSCVTLLIIGIGQENTDKRLIEEFPELSSVTSLLKNNESQALKLINQLRLEQTTKQNVKRQYWLHRKAAEIYQIRRQNHQAIAAYKQTLQFRNDKNINETINALEQEISKRQKERTQRTFYRDLRNAGIAKKLKGDIVIAYIFVNDNHWSRWSNKDRLYAMDKTQLVTQWYKEQSQVYNIESLSFETRYFFLNAKQLLSAKRIKQRDYFNYLSRQLAKQLGYHSIESWLNVITKNDPDKQVALVFHSNSSDRSFALPCRYRKEKCFYEHTQILKKTKRERWHWPLEQTLAHEVLHLFGADDLYSIKEARDFATTDIMNYLSADLAYDEITPITAWAIGWHPRPKTPFTLEN